MNGCFDRNKSVFIGARVFAFKDGELQLLCFTKENEEITAGRYIGSKRLEYIEDGMLAVHWWSNEKPYAGVYTTFYELDVDALSPERIIKIR